MNIQCKDCGCDVEAIQRSHKYCRPCREHRHRAQERERQRKKAKELLVVPVEIHIGEVRNTRKFFHSTLASTPEVPASGMFRDYQLTGNASAVNHGASMGLVGAGI